MIPEGWQAKPLAEVADYKAGRTPARARQDYWQGPDQGVDWVSISDMTEFGTVSETKEKITPIAFEQVFRSVCVPAGTLIMSFKLTIGRIATLGVDACHNEAIIAIYPRAGVDQRFLGYFLSQVDYDGLQDRQVKGNTLNRDKIDRIEVWLPPLAEQGRIADVLDVVRSSIEVQDAARSAAASVKRAAMRRLFTEGLRGETQKETEIGLVPESWSVEPLASRFSVASGGTPSRSNPSYWTDGTIPWVKTTEVNYCTIRQTEEHITEAGLEGSSAKMLSPGTLLLAMYGQGATRGKVAILGIEAACNQACAAITAIDDRASTRYLYHYLTANYEAIRQLAHGGQQQNLNLEIVRGLPVPFPDDQDEQRDTVAVLDAIDSKVDVHRRRRAVLDELFGALLHDLMSGEIRVSDLDLSVLEAPLATEVAT